MRGWNCRQGEHREFQPFRNRTSKKAIQDFAAPVKFPVHSRVAWLWPILASLFGYVSIHKGLDYPIHYDAEHVYLPAAQAFLEQGWSYLLTEDSYRVVPLAYLWPALWGADPHWIRMANAGLWTGMVYFIWQTGTLMGGIRTAIAAILLLVLHPQFIDYFYTELTEPIFLFGIFGFIYQLSRICIEKKFNAATLLLGALMLTITLLSRPVLQLLAPALLLACALAYIGLGYTRHPIKAERPLLRSLALMFLLGLIVPALMTVKNGMFFSLWGLGTGSGTGLYLGTHPLSQGTEPPFFGLNYDVNELAMWVTSQGDHLSLGADRAARAAALLQIQSMGLSDGVFFFLRKLWWWLMHHPAQINATYGNLRKYRIFEFATILVALGLMIWKIRRPSPQSSFKSHARPVWFAGLLLVFFAAILIQLIPILYNARYSSALLDPWLMLLSAFGIGIIIEGMSLEVRRQSLAWSLTVRSTASVGAFVICLAALLLMMPLGYNAAKKFEYPVAIDPAHLDATRVLANIQDDDEVHANGMSYLGDHQWRITSYPASLHVKLSEDGLSSLQQASPNNAIWLSRLAIQPPNDRCGKAEISYHTDAGVILQPAYKLPLLLHLHANGELHALATHANGELRPQTAGSYRIVLHCPADTLVEWRGTQLLESEHAVSMAKQFLQEPARAP